MFPNLFFINSSFIHSFIKVCKTGSYCSRENSSKFHPQKTSCQAWIQILFIARVYYIISETWGSGFSKSGKNIKNKISIFCCQNLPDERWQWILQNLDFYCKVMKLMLENPRYTYLSLKTWFFCSVQGYLMIKKIKIYLTFRWKWKWNDFSKSLITAQVSNRV